MRGTLQKPAARTAAAGATALGTAPDTGIVPGSRAELTELSDNALLAKVRALPRDNELRAAACEILVDRYQKLVRSCVRQYRGSPEPTEDLMQVGYVGLLKAINNYNPEVGDSLSAYAQPCISGEIKRHFRDKRWQIHVRRSAQELLLALRKAAEDLTQQFGRPPTEEELAERLGVTQDAMQEARQADLVFSTYSLDAPMSDRDDPALLADMLGDDDPAMAHAIDMESVNAHWEELPEREQRILVMRFYGNLTQTEIGDRLGISQMHVSRLLARALGHLKSRLLEPAETDTPPSAATAYTRRDHHENRSGTSTDRRRRDPRVRRDDEYLSLQPAHGRLGADHHRHHRHRRPAARLRLGRAARVHPADPLPAGSPGGGSRLPDVRHQEPGQHPRPGGPARPRRAGQHRGGDHIDATPSTRDLGAEVRPAAETEVIEDVYDE